MTNRMPLSTAFSPILPVAGRTYTVATHHRRFHADEVVAYAILLLAGFSLTLLRLDRNDPRIAQADFKLDVGRKFDPENGWFDHHQGSGSRKVGAGAGVDIPYATAGLVWKVYGPRICNNDPKVWQDVEDRIVALVDASDTGVPMRISLGKVLNISQMISQANGNPQDEEEQHALFLDRAEEMVKQIGNLIRNSQREKRDYRVLERAISAAVQSDGYAPRILELKNRVDWRDSSCRTLLLRHGVDIVLMPNGPDTALQVVRSDLTIPSHWKDPRHLRGPLKNTDGIVIPNRRQARAPTLEAAHLLARHLLTVADENLQQPAPRNATSRAR